MLTSRYFERRRASWDICIASSLVGARTSTLGEPGLLFSVILLRRILVKDVIKKAAVLPVPVCACPMASFPSRPLPSISIWIGVQYWKLRSKTACMISSGRSKSWNLFFPSTGGTLNSSGFHLTAILAAGLGIGLVVDVGLAVDDDFGGDACLAGSVCWGFL